MTDGEKNYYDWGNKTILVVEDVETNFQFFKAALRKTNCEIIWAKDGQEAVDLCKNNKDIDLVLMDIQLPVLSGYDATILIKEFRKELPIIAQTAYALINDRRRILKSGCDDYIAKPIKPKEFLAKVEKLIGS
jgi:CheY-like chemotaxis protein